MIPPGGEHYNIIGIHWGSGGTGRHLFTGIKAARVIESLSKDFGLDVSTIHGLGFRYGRYVHQIVEFHESMKFID